MAPSGGDIPRRKDRRVRALILGLCIVSPLVAGLVPAAGPAGTTGLEHLVAARGRAAVDGADGSASAPQARGTPLRSGSAAGLSGRRVKPSEELRVEQLIESTFRKYVRQVSIRGRSLTLRMPFGLNGEREGSRRWVQRFYLGGKGSPEELWRQIDAVLASRQFNEYLDALAAPGEKVVRFDLERGSYSVSQEPELLEALKNGSYPGSPARIFVYRSQAELSEADLYNYLYAVAAIGVDCSGFSHYFLQTLARAYGTDLDRGLAAIWHTPPEQVRNRVGLWFYHPATGFTEAVPDRIEDLRPGDMILFRGSDGLLKHSALIQSIDYDQGLIRYVQSTDWAIKADRGAHASLIRFDPQRPGVGLGHYSVQWLQQVRPPFDGEREPRDWRTDGDRYRWYPAAGGSLVVRLRALAAALLQQEPRFYTNLYGGPAP